MSQPMEGLLQAAQEIASRRREVLERLKDALERNDREEVVELAKQLCGVDDETSNRTNPSIN